MTGAQADYEAVVAARDRVRAEAHEQFAEKAAELDEQERGAPRWLRRRIAKARRLIERRRRALDRRIDAIFARITRGYDPETGTLEGVQEDAEAMLAAALR